MPTEVASNCTSSPAASRVEVIANRLITRPKARSTFLYERIRLVCRPGANRAMRTTSPGNRANSFDDLVGARQYRLRQHSCCLQIYHKVELGRLLDEPTATITGHRIKDAGGRVKPGQDANSTVARPSKACSAGRWIGGRYVWSRCD